ncbi:hypothetical protein [Mucilaginibacter sp. L3T2-6]|uniref:hypothetical protein n=1 Tax=Mucilaginibacter sp. L3T2-6 TaxID=3062491 RepID=UPI00267469ED|nr:hypothetical protein [Mucilaginibacter sp. L3T2-6]MDO3640985.1 hypothetical protein [Mucilaginibacter sp. L3T2-6]MDV6213539.1 hypothetical protein [Mucilaginibacter sp. L3T2-6]
MKKLSVLLLVVVCLAGCSHGKYKQAAIEYLKARLPDPASLDTVKFLKPDSLYTTFHDTDDYRALMKGLNTFEINGDSVQAAQTRAAIAQKEKSYKHKVTGWDVLLIYKAKNNKGQLQLDTCRFTFESTLTIVKDLNGVNLAGAKN